MEIWNGIQVRVTNGTYIVRLRQVFVQTQLVKAVTAYGLGGRRMTTGQLFAADMTQNDHVVRVEIFIDALIQLLDEILAV